MAYEEYYGRSGITDPKTIAMLRRRKMAEDLMKTGSDTSPAATPLVGLSRVLQGLVGGYTAGMADKDAADASAATDAERQAAMAQAQALIDGAGGGGGTMPAMVQPTAQPAQTGNTYGRILAAESGGSMQPGIYGDGGAAAGPGQVHAAALADVNRANGTNYTHEQLAAQPEVGKQVGQAYYKQLLEMFGGDERKATAAYNAGPGRVKAAEAQYGAEWEKGLPAATREQYLPKVFGAPSAAPQAGAPPQPDSMAYAKRLIGQAAQFAQSPDPRIRALAGPLEKNAQLALTQAERDQSRTFQRDTLAIQQAEAQRVRDEQRVYEEQKAAAERARNPDPMAREQFNQANVLRDEFGKLTADFRTVQGAYENIRSAAASQSGAGDMSMLYSYVKLLDPTSVVRESEFATAAASGSFGERVQGAAQRILTGERMPDGLRQDFLKEARSIYGNQRKGYEAIGSEYEKLAKRFKLDPAAIVTKFARDQEEAEAPQYKPGSPESGDWRPTEAPASRLPPPPAGARIVR